MISFEIFLSLLFDLSRSLLSLRTIPFWCLYSRYQYFLSFASNSGVVSLSFEDGRTQLLAFDGLPKLGWLHDSPDFVLAPSFQNRYYPYWQVKFKNRYIGKSENYFIFFDETFASHVCSSIWDTNYIVRYWHFSTKISPLKVTSPNTILFINPEQNSGYTFRIPKDVATLIFHWYFKILAIPWLSNTFLMVIPTK